MRIAAGVVANTSKQWKPTSRRRPRCSSSRWLWTATTCLVAASSGSVPRMTGPLASALAFYRGGNSNSSFRRGLSSTRSSDDSNVSTDSFTIHSSLSELLKEFDYDALILDQFGVLHNGKNALDGTIDCVETIALGNNSDGDENGETKEKKLRLIVLSNTSSPSKTTLDRLHNKLGFERSYFCGAVTSGEEAGRHIQTTYGTSGKKSKFVWCTWDASNENVPDPAAFLDLLGPNMEPTVDISDADFVVAHGSGAIRGFGKNQGGNDESGTTQEQRQHETISMGNFLEDGNLGEGTPINNILEQCADRNLPLVCANPDMVVQYHDGSLKHMPGKIAGRYQEILEERRKSGKIDCLPSITIYGKPHTEHFEACLRKLEEDRKQRHGSGSSEEKELSPLRVAHVGDSIHHDIAGANAAGVPSIFIVGGIHAGELLSRQQEGDENDTSDDEATKTIMPSEERLREFFDKEGITPTHVLPLFKY